MDRAEEKNLLAMVSVVKHNQEDTVMTAETDKGAWCLRWTKRSWWLEWRVPVVSFVVLAVIAAFQILIDNGTLDPKKDKDDNDYDYCDDRFLMKPFVSTWYNCGGFLKHTLPNLILFAAVTVPTELMVGSFNCLLQWLLNYYFVVLHTYGNPGCGSSTQVYFQFTVFGGAIFLTKFLFPALLNKINTQAGDSEGKCTGLTILKTICWWLLGICVLLGVGWMWNGLILLAIIIAEKSGMMGDMNIGHYTHNVLCGMGYFGTLLLAALLWYQNPVKSNNLNDVEMKFGVFKIVLIKRQINQEPEDGQSSTVSARNCPIFPFCREIVLILSMVCCVGLGTVVLNTF